MAFFAALERLTLFFCGPEAHLDSRRLSGLLAGMFLIGLLSPGHAQNGLFGGLAGGASQNLQDGLGTGGASMFGWRPYLGADGIWTHNMTDANTPAVPVGDRFNLGVYGGMSVMKQWSRSALGLNYRGYARFWQQRDEWQTSQSHILSMGTTHRVSPRIQANTSLLGGIAMGGMGLGSIFGGVGPISPLSAFGLSQGANAISETAGNPNDNNLVDDEFVDTNSQFVAVNADMTYQLSERAYLQGGAGGYAVRRGTLFGLNGFTLRAGTGYTLSSRTTVGAYYSFNRYDIVNAFNNVQVQMVGVSLQHMFSPRLTVSGWVGAYRLFSEFVGRVPLDPVLAELLGQPTGQEIGRRLTYTYSGAIRATRRFERSTLTGYVVHGFFPGNGAVLPSNRTRLTATYSYTGLDRWTLSAQANYSDYRSFFQENIRVRNGSVLGFAGYRFKGNLYVRVGGGFRVLNTTTQSGRTYQAVAMVGVTWTPGDFPFIF